MDVVVHDVLGKKKTFLHSYYCKTRHTAGERLQGVSSTGAGSSVTPCHSSMLFSVLFNQWGTVVSHRHRVVERSAGLSADSRRRFASGPSSFLRSDRQVESQVFTLCGDVSQVVGLFVLLPIEMIQEWATFVPPPVAVNVHSKFENMKKRYSISVCQNLRWQSRQIPNLLFQRCDSYCTLAVLAAGQEFDGITLESYYRDTLSSLLTLHRLND